MKLDDELREDALHALREAFSGDLQQLVNAYKAAAAGLDDDDPIGNDLVQIYTWPDDTGAGDMRPNIYTDWLSNSVFFPSRDRNSCGHQTLHEALTESYDCAERIVMQGQVVFVKRDGEWFVAPKEEKP